jgi:hypothetical protein
MHEDKDWGKWNEPVTGKIFSEIRDGYGYWVTPGEKRDIYTNHTIFAFCSYITSTARITLYKHIERARDVYYCDTDSILTPTELPTGTALGDLKLEGIVREGIFLKPKTYHIKFEDGKEYKRMKGIPFKDMPKDICQRKIKVVRYSKSKESIRRNLIAGTELIVEKSNNWDADDKRVFKANGTSRPFRTTMIDGVMSIG